MYLFCKASLSIQYLSGVILIRLSRRGFIISMVAYAFTRIALSSVRKEPCKGGILVEEGILRKAQSPSGATFSYQPPTTKDVEPFAVIIPER
jgi:hypothetical protein